MKMIGKGLLAAAMLLGSTLVQAQWELDNSRSSLDFLSIKNDAIAESHQLFKTAQFPAANISANVSPEVLAIVTDGGVVSTDIEVMLTLHDKEASLSVPVLVTGTEGGLLRVISARPVVINAETFGLAEGVQALQSVAGLNAISTAVPVTFNLVFAPAGG